MPEGDVTRIQPTQVATGGDTLGLAFADDPLFDWLLPPSAKRTRRLQRWFRAIVREETRSTDHIVDVVAGGDGVAVWHDVDRWKSPPSAIVRTAAPSLAAFGTRSIRGLRVLAAMERSHPAEPHRHLMYIGVNPRRQGEGLGGRLLADAIDRCDTEGLPAYLENSNPRNEALYARFGFVRHHEVPLPAGAPPLVAMWRDPR